MATFIAIAVAASFIGNDNFVPIDDPRLTWLVPLSKSSRFLTISARQPNGSFEARVWPDKSRQPLVLPTLEGLSVSPIRTGLAVCDQNGATILNLDKWTLSKVSSAYDVGWSGEVPSWVEPEQDPNILRIGSHSLTPPAGRQFLLVTNDGFVATQRPARKKPEGEDQYLQRVEIWRIVGARLKPLGISFEHWWDGGSSGCPKYLAVAGNGTLLIDSPGGGSVWHLPVVVPKSKRPVSPFREAKRGLTDIVAEPLAFRDGIVCEVSVIKDADLRKHMSDGKLSDYYSNWLAWFDGRIVRMRQTPKGFLNAWRISDQRMGYAVRVKGGVQNEEVSLPPKNWKRLK